MKFIHVIGLSTVISVACSKSVKLPPILPAPVITGTDTLVVKTGDTLTVFGKNFSTVPSENLLSIGGNLTTITDASPTRLKAFISRNAVSGKLSIFLKGSSSFTYTSQITVIASGQPFVKRVTPANIEAQDTVFISGVNFGESVNSTALQLGSSKFDILDISDTLIKALVAPVSKSGNLFITNNGLISPPFPLSINRINPQSDGTLFWTFSANADDNTVWYYAGKADDELNGSGRFLTSFTKQFSLLPAPPVQTQNIQTKFYFVTAGSAPNVRSLRIVANNNFTSNSGDADFVRDNSGNLYCWAIGSTRANYFLLKITENQARIIWTYQLDATHREQIDLALRLDGDELYFTNNTGREYYKGNISSVNPSFSKVTLGNRDQSYLISFAKTRIYYALTPNQSGAPYINKRIASSMRDGNDYKILNTGNLAIPIIPGDKKTWEIVDIRSSPTHGDSLLVLVDRQLNATRNTTGILLYDPASNQFKTLYDRNNWAGADHVKPLLSDLVWAGDHMYYATDEKRIYRFSLTGRDKRPALVYNDLLMDNTKPNSGNFFYYLFNEFIAKK